MMWDHKVGKYEFQEGLGVTNFKQEVDLKLDFKNR